MVTHLSASFYLALVSLVSLRSEFKNVPSILIVDDDEQVRSLLGKFLGDEDYEITVAADGREAVRIYRQQPSDLVIFDIFMPGQEGLQTLTQLQRDCPGLKSIAISGGGLTNSLEYLNYAESFGVNRTFAKPIKLKELLRAVIELVGEAGRPRSGPPR